MENFSKEEIEKYMREAFKECEKAIKEDKKLTQVELAHKVGIAPASVNKWMNGVK